MTIRSAMILAAGLGTRLRPITETLPKPLVPVGGRPLIAYSLEAARAAGIDNIVANVHYRADQLETWLKQSGFDVGISDEREALLDSGGGLRHALPQLGSDPFLVLNADTFWLEDPAAARTNLDRLMTAFDRERMEMLLMTARPQQATGHDGAGDFSVDQDGRLARSRSADAVIYAGALILDPRCLQGDRPQKFSLNLCFDEAIDRGTLFGMPMAGQWLTVGTPDAIPEAEAAMQNFCRQTGA
ncbi:nucleotidyltransferase family protein [Pseudohoeflea coraliihabitans]|uniref:Nucleotidyltransferase family protein n=1 Tax=Pseudohoeflea coraliihabitans TaxID=2860393 RepID=A0ABS6WVH9_9HYPH|nr:nucleotidyltransferase family protein [Pseudohoeflea sp. DP4N28-3]MBW3099104.1 nucleotidyltransferase family protein [Pseudohoeflea sp. DP4N28-3]